MRAHRQLQQLMQVAGLHFSEAGIEITRSVLPSIHLLSTAIHS